MIQYKKIIMTLALLLTAVTGAWAQSSLKVVEFKVPADWAKNESPVTAGDLPGFKASNSDEVNALGALTEGYAVLFYAFDGENASYVFFIEGSPKSNTTTPYKKNLVFNNSTSEKFYYTAEPTEWDLTSQDGKAWTLAKMPASNIELQVEYYAESNLFLSKEALAAKGNIAVKNGETAVDFDADGKSTTTVTEGNTVTVTYNGSKKVIGVKAEKKAPAVTVTWNYDDITGTGKTFTKDGVTITAGNIDFSQKNFMNGGTFTTTLGNFTKIEVSGGNCTASGEGWSGDNTKTWTGNASSVSFSGKIHGNGEGTLKFVFTIEPTN